MDDWRWWCIKYQYFFVVVVVFLVEILSKFKQQQQRNSGSSGITNNHFFFFYFVVFRQVYLFENRVFFNTDTLWKQQTNKQTNICIIFFSHSFRKIPEILSWTVSGIHLFLKRCFLFVCLFGIETLRNIKEKKLKTGNRIL